MPRFLHLDVATPRTRASAIAALVLLTSVGAADARAQSGASQRASEQQPAFRSSAALVLQPVAVLDRDGRPVADLSRDDFTVEEDGVRQELHTFLAPDATPLDVALVLDSSASLFHFGAVVRRAASTFLMSLDARDCVYLLPFNDFVGPGTWGRPFEPRITRRVGGLFMEGGTSLYDALVEAIGQLEPDEPDGDREDDRDAPARAAVATASTRCGPSPGADESGAPLRRRAIVLLTDGSDENSQTRFDEVLDRANAASVPIYPVITGAARRGPRLREIMSRFAGQTGGSVLEAVSPDDLRAAYDDVVSMLRASYLLGYLPPGERDGTWREVRVRSKRPSHRLVYRTRYFR